MEQQDNMHILLSMQEHPEQYTDEQLHQLIADNPELAEQLEQLALTKQAFVKHEADEEVIPVEDEWQKFAAEHADEFEALDTHAPLPRTPWLRSSPSPSSWVICSIVRRRDACSIRWAIRRRLSVRCW